MTVLRTTLLVAAEKSGWIVRLCRFVYMRDGEEEVVMSGRRRRRTRRNAPGTSTAWSGAALSA